MIKFHVQSEIAAQPVREFFAPLIDLVAGELQLKNEGEVSLILTDDAQIQEMNREWRGKDHPTDVLSFDYSEDKKLNGEIYISLDTARKQAKIYEQDLCSEMARLFTHGLIHLSKIDHEISEQKDRFFEVENSVLEQFQKQFPENNICIQDL